MKLKRLHDAEHILWSIIQSYGYKLTPEFAYKLAEEHFNNYDDKIIEMDDDDPKLENIILKD